MSQSSNAAEAQLRWIEPTHNTDGSVLTDLASYGIRYGCSASGVYPVLETLSAPAISYVVTGLPDAGSCYFVAYAVNSSGAESGYSNEAIKVMGSVSMPGPVIDTAVTWVESPEAAVIYFLPETDFTGTSVVAGNWSVPGQSLTIDFEITQRSFGGDQRIISKAAGLNAQLHYFMVSERKGKLRFRLRTNGFTTTLYGVTAIPKDVKITGKAVYDGQKMYLYFNGQLDAQVGKTGDMDISDVEVWVGGNPPDNANPFDGLITVMVR